MIFLQAVIHMCVALGVMPVTGQTLPFISYGGTAYIFMGVGIGVIQSVAADTKRQQRQAARAAASSPHEDDPVNPNMQPINTPTT